ncbi:MAG: type II toxin-antitoxin system Phd/YefM family antitoxin [Vulcanimicrobiaceae bacterium]
MRSANIGEAKAHFSDLVKRAEGGEDVRILRNGVPIARLVAEKSSKKRYFAPDDGLGFVADDFNAPLPQEVLAQFYK